MGDACCSRRSISQVAITKFFFRFGLDARTSLYWGFGLDVRIWGGVFGPDLLFDLLSWWLLLVVVGELLRLGKAL